MILYLGVFDLTETNEILNMFGFRPLYIFNWYEALAKFVLQVDENTRNGKSKYRYYRFLVEKYCHIEDDEKYYHIIDNNPTTATVSQTEVYTPAAEKTFKTLTSESNLENFFKSYYNNQENRHHMTVYDWYISLDKERIERFFESFYSSIAGKNSTDSSIDLIKKTLLEYKQIKEIIGEAYFKRVFPGATQKTVSIDLLRQDDNLKGIDFSKFKSDKESRCLKITRRHYSYIGAEILKKDYPEYYYSCENDTKKIVAIANAILRFISLSDHNDEFSTRSDHFGYYSNYYIGYNYNIDRDLVILSMIYEFFTCERISRYISKISDNKQCVKRIENIINKGLCEKFSYSPLNAQFPMDYLLLTALYSTDLRNNTTYPFAWILDDLPQWLNHSACRASDNLQKHISSIKENLIDKVDEYISKFEVINDT